MSSNLFSKIGNFFGKVALAVVHAVGIADKTIDADAPEIEKLLTEGASVATLIPGVGPEIAPLLNAGVTLVGQLKNSLDVTAAMDSTMQAQIAALAPAGYSIILIESDVKVDVESLLASYEAEFAAGKVAVTAAATAA